MYIQILKKRIDGSSFARPEVAFSGPGTATPIMPNVKEFSVFDSVSIIFVHITGAQAYREQAFRATVTSNDKLNKVNYSTLQDRCPVCLSVTLVYCGQTVGWIKMPIGTEVGLGPGGTVLDGDRAPPRKGAQQLLAFRSTLLLHVAHLSNC